MAFYHHTLANGLQIVGEDSRSARSVASGFFVKTGSRDEAPEEAGLSHFLEHMVFKGTDRRSAEEVNRDFDRLGADYNAYTSEENTVFYGIVLPEFLPQTIDLLADILRPTLRQEDFDMEKNVILEEIGMYEDRPGVIAYDYAKEVFFRKHKLGNSVLGSKESVSAITREQMADYFQRRYAASNITLAVTGAFDWDQVVSLAEEHCGTWFTGEVQREGIEEAQGSGDFELKTREEVTQEHMILMSPGPSLSSPLRFAADLLGVALGDDSGSRLFWALIAPGLVDSAGAGYQMHEGTGVLYTSYSCEPGRVEPALEIVHKVLREVEENGITPEELEQARSKILSLLVRRSERPRGRLGEMGLGWTYLKEYRSIDDDLRGFEEVTLDQIRDVLRRYPPTRVTTFGMGPMTKISRSQAS